VATGDSAVAAAGKRPQRIGDFENDVTSLRTYLQGGEVRVGKQSSRIEWADRFSFEPPPIEMVCSGPRAITVAAHLADRISLGIGTNPERARWALSVVDEVLSRTGRERDSIRIGMSAPVAVTTDRPSGRAAIRTRVAAWAHMSSGRGMDLSAQPEILQR
jgi:alkanesulfonate monooxygenase SsuD/methylene tetrahydromethanopterin reductase-like flavin-dependent oxidoreductase (luciferase family)